MSPFSGFDKLCIILKTILVALKVNRRIDKLNNFFGCDLLAQWNIPLRLGVQS
jgi:hypothetical protein